LLHWDGCPARWRFRSGTQRTPTLHALCPHPGGVTVCYRTVLAADLAFELAR